MYPLLGVVAPMMRQYPTIESDNREISRRLLAYRGIRQQDQHWAFWNAAAIFTLAVLVMMLWLILRSFLVFEMK